MGPGGIAASAGHIPVTEFDIQRMNRESKISKDKPLRTSTGQATAAPEFTGLQTLKYREGSKPWLLASLRMP